MEELGVYDVSFCAKYGEKAHGGNEPGRRDGPGGRAKDQASAFQWPWRLQYSRAVTCVAVRAKTALGSSPGLRNCR